MTADELVVAIKKYAYEHYEEDGWDILVECCSDNEIKAAIQPSTETLEIALKEVEEEFALKLLNERRQSVYNEIF